MKHTTLLLALLLPAFAVLPDSSSSPDRQEYFVGYQRLDVDSPATGERFPVALTYPSDTPSKRVSFGPFNMDLAIDGRAASGPFPLVIVSHGSGGTNLGHRSIAFALVKHGYVVAMPLHPRNNFTDNQGEGTVANWINRPKHIHATIDTILSRPGIAEIVDDLKIAVIGHSAGGYTALAAAGGKADTAHILDLCLSGLEVTEPFCGLAKDNDVESVDIENPRDARIKAIVMLAPVGILFKSDDSLSVVNIPALLLRAQKDSQLTEPYQSEIIAGNYMGTDLLSDCTVPNAGHFSFITPFPKAIEAELGEIAKDPEGFNRETFHELLSSDVVNFLDRALESELHGTFKPVSCEGV